METQRQKIIQRIHELQDALKDEIEERRAEFRYRVEQRRVVFEEDMRRSHREARESLRSFLSRARPMVILTAPVIYSLIIPFALLDLFVSIYQAICFPVYGIAKVRRGDYIAIDRQHLAYLNGLQKLNCTYCGYCNGLVEYVREVASRTEQYWCPIKHSRRLADTHARYDRFTDFGDAEGYRSTWMKLRDEMANDQPPKQG
ncbi:hypothetical protein [Actibacterium lipolyticum]|uniref:Uncharacterized protein n=1 Tax=Actibacterium lipolyticum TaxID=1524263 RepID=A0A238KPS2_9RHOB|nr:hypothetical protein [Actibacterium lipolyticum]SMX44631.1 hypothetical protein COL8621_02596 [Actibacterium lipolyticum]